MHTIEQKASTEAASPSIRIRSGDAAAAVPQSAVWPVSGESRIDRIARRAHEIYEARGGRNGKAVEDWLEAERDIDSAGVT